MFLETETAEEAFHRLTASESSAYAKLMVMLEAQSNMKQINEGRYAAVKKRRSANLTMTHTSWVKPNSDG